MNDLNHLILIGRLTRTVGGDERSFGYTSGGQARATLSVAYNSTKKVGDEWQDEANFVNVTLWGRQAETLKQYLTKGQQVCIDGHIKMNKWEKDGQTHYETNIIADHVQLLAKPTGSGQSQQRSGNYTQSQQATTQTYSEDGSEDFPEDIPF